MLTFKQLAIKHDCDKATEGDHTYDLAYEFHFERFRNKEINLLEIGAGGYNNPDVGGASLRMWKEYFTHPDTQIYSIDIYDKNKIQEDRITILQGSQNDEDFLNGVAHQIGGINVIIDDGSHVNSDVITSFKVLFPKLKSGGIYVVEDVQTSYWEHYGGRTTENHDLQWTTMDFFKFLLDGLNYKEVATESRGKGRTPQEPLYFDLNILSIHFYHNLIFIYKGDNSITL